MYRFCFSYYVFNNDWKLSTKYSRGHENNQLLYSFIGGLLVKTLAEHLTGAVGWTTSLFIRVYIVDTKLQVYCKKLWGRTSKIYYSLDDLKQLTICTKTEEEL